VSFSERAVERCLRLMKSLEASERAARDVIRQEEVDVRPFERYLSSENSMVRRIAVKIVAAHGNVDEVINAALVENDRSILAEMLYCLGERKEGNIKRLCLFLESDDDLVREATIKMFRRAGREDLLFSLMFDESDSVVERVKNYIAQKEERVESTGI